MFFPERRLPIGRRYLLAFLAIVLLGLLSIASIRFDQIREGDQLELVLPRAIRGALDNSTRPSDLIVSVGRTLDIFHWKRVEIWKKDELLFERRRGWSLPVFLLRELRIQPTPSDPQLFLKVWIPPNFENGFVFSLFIVLAAAGVWIIVRLQFEWNERLMAARAEYFHLAKQTAHDLRSPVGALRILVRSAGGSIEPELRTLLESAVRSIGQISDSLLLKSNASRGASISEIELQLRKVIDLKKLEWSLGPSIAMEVEHEIADATTCFRMPHGGLDSILSNLLNNAKEAGHPLDRPILVRMVSSAGELRVEVVDAGKGIPVGVLKSLLKGESGVSTKQSGNGLGLSGAMKKMREVDGRLELDSEDGVGTRVRLYFSENGV